MPVMIKQQNNRASTSHESQKAQNLPLNWILSQIDNKIGTEQLAQAGALVTTAVATLHLIITVQLDSICAQRVCNK